MKRLMITAIVLFFHSMLIAQERRTIRVKAGQDVAQAYSTNGFYRLPQFSKATLVFSDGNRNKVLLMNYNILSGTMQFINQQKDTLDIARPEGLDSILFATTSFIYRNGFMEIIGTADSISLLKKPVIRTQIENIGAYGIPNQTGSIDNLRNVAFGTNVYNFSINQDIVINENIVLYFVYRKKNPVKANKPALFKLLPRNLQSRADATIKTNKTNFDKEKDLLELFAELSRS